MIGTKLWRNYDKKTDDARFFMFMSLVVLPFGILGFLNLNLGFFYIIFLMGWRTLAIRKFNKELTNKELYLFFGFVAIATLILSATLGNYFIITFAILSLFVWNYNIQKVRERD